MWAEAEDEMGLNSPLADPAKVAEVRRDLHDRMMNSERRAQDAKSDLDEFRSLLGPKRAAAPEGTPMAALEDDLAEMRQRLSATVAEPPDE